MIVILALLAMQAPVEAPRLALALQPATGAADEEVAALHRRILTELRELGFDVASAAPLSADCAAEPPCVEQARGAMPALLVVDLVRVGPVLQLTATGTAPASTVAGTKALDAVELVAPEANAPLLPDDVRAWASTVAQASVVVAPPPPPPPGVGIGGAVVAGAAGGAALLSGVVLVGITEAILADPNAPRLTKEDAIARGYIGLVAIALGAVVLGGAGVLFALDTGAPASAPGTLPP